MKTPFRELAESIAKNMKEVRGCCSNLPGIPSDFFIDFFMPTAEEREEYDCSLWWWMGGINTTIQQDNQDRITALLFADQLWQDEENYKYERI